MPAVETARGTIWYEDHRQSDSDTPVLMLHGAGGSHRHFPIELRELPEANAIVPDLPGHGESPPPGRSSIVGYVTDVIALLDALAIPQAIVLGHSMGGAIAQTLAVDYPERVRGLILIGTGAKLSVHPGILGALMTKFLHAVKTIIKWSWSQNGSENLRNILGYTILIGTPVEIVYGDYYACNQFDIRTRLSQIRVPTLIIGGTIDQMTPHKYSDYLHQNIAGSMLMTVKDGAHMMVLEKSTIVVDIVREWLNKLKGG